MFAICNSLKPKPKQKSNLLNHALWGTFCWVIQVSLSCQPLGIPKLQGETSKVPQIYLLWSPNLEKKTRLFRWRCAHHFGHLPFIPAPFSDPPHLTPPHVHSALPTSMQFPCQRIQWSRWSRRQRIGDVVIHSLVDSSMSRYCSRLCTIMLMDMDILMDKYGNMDGWRFYAHQSTVFHQVQSDEDACLCVLLKTVMLFLQLS